MTYPLVPFGSFYCLNYRYIFEQKLEENNLNPDHTGFLKEWKLFSYAVEQLQI